MRPKPKLHILGGRMNQVWRGNHHERVGASPAKRSQRPTYVSSGPERRLQLGTRDVTVNLTFAGLSHQGELNVDVLDHDACDKLARWFEDRWDDRWCMDISDELVQIIDESWAREDLIPPYHIYVKMAYHLSQEARAGLAEFRIPRDFGDKLFEFQKAAVKIAAHHLNKRGGVLIGDEDDRNNQVIIDLYNEKAGILGGDADTEVDLASYAYQIWKNAITDDPALERIVEALPPVVFSTKAVGEIQGPSGALVYLRTAEGNDALAWVDREGNSVTESQFGVLKAAECLPDTPALPRYDKHHQLVQRAVELIVAEEKSVGGQLGRPSGARFRTYERLKRYAEEIKGTLFESPALAKAIDEIYRYPLRQGATDTLNRQLRSGISDVALAELVTALREEDRLCIIKEEEQTHEPRIICSMGLSPNSDVGRDCVCGGVCRG